MEINNQYFAQGKMFREPSLRKIDKVNADSTKQTSVVNFTLVVSTSFNDKNGREVQEKAFVDCEAWDTAADLIEQNFQKGAPMYVIGRFRTDSWTTKTGEKRSRLILRVERFFTPFAFSRKEVPVNTNKEEEPAFGEF